MRVIGLTGGFGSGKSSVSDWLADKGIPIVDADKVARRCLYEDKNLLKLLAENFGKEIVDGNGELNRKLLGRIAFSSQKSTNLLNSLTHPAIAEKCREEIEELSEAGFETCILEVPLLIESGMDSLVDEIWVVVSDTERKIERLQKRDSLSRQEILDRMARQTTDEEKKKIADVIIENDGDLSDLYSKLSAISEERGILSENL